MAVKDKVFYWLKLKTEFMTGEVIDFLMSQKNGANYVVLYQMLCIKTINTKGELATKIGEVLVPFDVDKIQRECKWFDRDTIIVAMELYKKLGLLYMQESGIIKIAEFEELVGNETYWAKQKRLSSSRNEQKESVGNTLENVQQPLISNISNSITLNSEDKKEQDIIDSFNFTDTIKSKVLEWLQYKKERKQSYKPTGLKQLLKRVKSDFEQYGESYVLAEFENSMLNNYSGLFAANGKAQGGKATKQTDTTSDYYADLLKATTV